MKAILIDVIKKTVTDIEQEPGNPALYKVLQCDTITGVTVTQHPRMEKMFIDDNGLLIKDDAKIGAFKFGGHVFSGHGIIVGIDGAGVSVSTLLTAKEIEPLIEFCSIDLLPKPEWKIKML